MGKCRRFSTFSFLFLFFISFNTWAIDLGIAAESLKEGVKRNLGVRAYENLSSDTDKKTVFLETNCTIPFSSLSYVGVKMTGNPSCRGAEWQCKLRDAVVDPFDKELNAGAPAKPGVMDVYYYCTDGLGPVNTKKYICLNRAPQESSFRQINQNIEFKWDEGSSKCTCALKGVEGTSRQCDQAPPKFTDEEIAKADKVNGTAPTDPATSTAGTPSGDSTTTAPTAAAPPPKPTQPTKELSDCVSTWVSSSEDCKSAALAAQKSCDGNDKERKEAKEATAVIEGTKNNYVKSQTGAGAQQQCFVASLVSSGTRDAVTKMYESCQADITSCNDRCKAENLQQHQSRCESLVAAPGHEDEDSPNKKLFASATQQVQSNMGQGAQICTQDAKKKQSDLSQMLTNLGVALTDAVQCICKLSVNGIGGANNCEVISTVAQCEQNPNASGCHVYGGVSACVVGPGYNAQLCACQTNPKGAGCPGGPGSGNLSTFAAGPNLKDSAGNTVAFGPFSNSGIKGSNFDIGSGSGDGVGDISGNQAALPSGSSVMSASGSNGVSGNGSDIGSGELEDKSNANGGSGISGFFNQAKNFMKSALGIADKPTKGNGDLTDPNAKKENPVGKFKPRGLSADMTEAGLGRKNMDIWKMMNMCTASERCKTNENNYILGP